MWLTHIMYSAEMIRDKQWKRWICIHLINRGMYMNLDLEKMRMHSTCKMGVLLTPDNEYRELQWIRSYLTSGVIDLWQIITNNRLCWWGVGEKEGVDWHVPNLCIRASGQSSEGGVTGPWLFLHLAKGEATVHVGVLCTCQVRARVWWVRISKQVVSISHSHS